MNCGGMITCLLFSGLVLLAGCVGQKAIDGLICDMVRVPGTNYEIQRTEVTQAQWEAVMGGNPSEFKGPDNPVENVSWNDCQEFIKKLNDREEVRRKGLVFRLPTEEEREYCCRAGSKSDWGKRDNGDEGPLAAMGWYRGNSGNTTHPVAQKEPNAWGLYDMHGNVWEWTSTSDGDYRVLSGGGWFNLFWSCAAGFRLRHDPDGRDGGFGFRLVSEDL